MWESGDADANTTQQEEQEQENAAGQYRPQQMITLCHMCDPTDKIRGTFFDEGLVININKRMTETWYVYAALTKSVNGGIRVEERVGKVRLVNRGEFIHTGKGHIRADDRRNLSRQSRGRDPDYVPASNWLLLA